jgi:SAM-dependent methyltransferase
MSANYSFMVETARRLAPPPALLVDFGCGGAQIAMLARAAGYDARGCDRFENGWEFFAAEVGADPATGAFVDVIPEDGRLPYADGSCDVVLANMVFEHIEDWLGPLAEIARVLKPGGLFVAALPTWEAWREGHTGIPFAHRFGPGSDAQQRWLTFGHRLGLGLYRAGISRDYWVELGLKTLSKMTFYKRLPEIERLFATHFAGLERIEHDLVRHRLAQSRLAPLAGLIAPRHLDALLRAVAVRMGVVVFTMRRR